MPTPNPKKKLLFYQVCDGDFCRDAQLEFERMQQVLDRSGQKVTMVMKITLTPPSSKNRLPDKFKGIDYEITPATVKRKAEGIAEVNEQGVIVGDGKSISDLLQEELCDQETGESVLSFSKKAASNE